MQKFIIIIPVIEYTLELYQSTENKYAFESYRDDLRLLDKKIITDKYKLFIEDKSPRVSQVKIFICTLVDSVNMESAYEDGIENISNLINSMSLTYLVGFHPLYAEAIMVPIPGCNSITVNQIDLEITEVGNVSKIIVPFGCFNYLGPFTVSAEHKDYVSRYGSVPIITKDDKKVIELLRKDNFEKIEENLDKIDKLKLKHGDNLIDIIAELYNSSVTVENVSVAYLLLWQILETLASSHNYGSDLIKKGDLIKIEKLLKQGGYDIAIIDRVKSGIGQWRVKGDSQVIAEILKKYVFIKEDDSKIKEIIKKKRILRGNIIHPKANKKVNISDLQKNYKELRDIIEKLLKKLKEDL